MRRALCHRRKGSESSLRPTDRHGQPPRNCDVGGHHIAFKVDNLEVAKAYLADHGCKVMDGPIVLDQGPCATTRLRARSFRQSARPGRIRQPGIRSVGSGQDLPALTSEGELLVRNIAIIGSGQAALLVAHGLINSGYKVTLYSDRTADQWLNESRPTGTAAVSTSHCRTSANLASITGKGTRPKAKACTSPSAPLRTIAF